HIKRYIIADQVDLEDVSAATACLGVEGPDALRILTSLGAPTPTTDFAHAAWGEHTVAAVTATGQPGARIFCNSAAELIAQLEAAGIRPASADDVRVVR